MVGGEGEEEVCSDEGRIPHEKHLQLISAHATHVIALLSIISTLFNIKPYYHIIKQHNALKMRLFFVAFFIAVSTTNSFVPSTIHTRQCSISRSIIQSQPSSQCSSTPLFMSSTEAVSTEKVESTTEFPPILEELRDVAMKLHTREQSPREGKAEAPAKPAEPYVPTHADYLQFLVDSDAVYKVLEDIVNNNEELSMFRNTGIERTQQLEKDIDWMCKTHDLQRPDVGHAGSMYAKELKEMIKSSEDIPEFMCHYYNYYFAHLAGGRMIGKQMSKLLLDGETLEFYKVSGEIV